VDNNENEYIKLKEKSKNETESQASLRWWKNHLRKNDSIIIDLFYGQLRNKIICDECKNNSITYEPFMILPLYIPCDKFSLEIKYFGLNFEYRVFNINLNEESKCNDYKIKLVEKINEDKRNDKNMKKK
jgi:ubiquitin C-terminal hydrolase